MQCPSCGKTGFVNVGGERFCSNCGAKLAGGAGKPASMADITTTHKTLDLRAAAPASPLADTSQPAAVQQQPPAAAAQPAAQMHSRQVAGAAVLDLRPKPAAAPVVDAAPVASAPTPETTTPAVKATTAATEATAAPVAPAAPDPMPASPVPGQVITPTVAAPDAAESVSTPTPQPIPASPFEPTAAPEPATPAPTPEPSVPSTPSTPQSPMIKKFPVRPETAAAKTAANTAAVAGSHIDAMSVQAVNAPAPPSPPQSPALQQALAAAKQSTATASVLKISAAVVAIGAMAGIVWLQNSPKLAFHQAAAKAGIDATLPTYIPSSYHQAGPITASVGQLSMQFTSPSATALDIKQRQTSWDSNSLRANYISQQTDNYLAIKGQGLTIYAFNNEADWVNHGVWYQVTGLAKLDRDQILRIVYGL